MRELAVFYCPKCGHYAYYQTSRHPLCPKCGGSVPMCMLRMYYTEFMKMTCEERDNYLAKEMLKQNPSILQRVSASRKRFNSRETIAELCTVIMDLDAENKVLSDTVNWMHDTIWDMLRQQRSSGAGPSSDHAGWQPSPDADISSREAAVTEELQENDAKIKA